jgi:hypothetical protein
VCFLFTSHERNHYCELLLQLLIVQPHIPRQPKARPCSHYTSLLAHIISTVATVIPASVTSATVTNASSSSASIHRIAVFTAAGYNHDKYDPAHLNYHRLHFRCLLLLPPFPPLFRQHFVPPRPCCRSCRVSSQFLSAAHHLAHRLRSLLHPISITHSPHSRSSRRTLLFCIRRFCFRCSRASPILIPSFFLPP